MTQLRASYIHNSVPPPLRLQTHLYTGDRPKAVIVMSAFKVLVRLDVDRESDLRRLRDMFSELYDTLYGQKPEETADETTKKSD